MNEANEVDGVVMCQVGSVWRHTNGNRYTVVCIANENTERPESYPVTVVYRGDNGRIWCRPISEWHRSMTIDT